MENQVEIPYHLMFHGYGGSEEYYATSSFNFLSPGCLPPTVHDHPHGFSVPSIHHPLAPPFFQDLYPRRPYDHHEDQIQLGSAAAPSLLFGTIHAELGKMTAQQIMDAKALAASKSHSEAERRRRERINGHLAKLRSMLPNTTKTDKASLLAEVIQHVKELKRQTSEIAVGSPLPTESDEITVSSTSVDDGGKFVVQASVCCEDRSDLLPDLIKALKALRLRPLKAEITSVGGRVKNVLLVAGEADHRECVAAIQDAFKSIVEHAAGTAAPAKQQDDVGSSSSAGGGSKRQRTSSMSCMIEQRSM